MKKILVLFSLIFASIFCFNANAQESPKQDPIVIKATMPIECLAFAANALNTIEIKGSEVDAFLVCQDALNKEIQKCVDAKKRTDENHTFDIRLDVAQSTANLLERAKLVGNDAIKYKCFINSLIEAGKNYKPAAK